MEVALEAEATLLVWPALDPAALEDCPALEPCWDEAGAEEVGLEVGSLEDPGLEVGGVEVGDEVDSVDEVGADEVVLTMVDDVEEVVELTSTGGDGSTTGGIEVSFEAIFVSFEGRQESG